MGIPMRMENVHLSFEPQSMLKKKPGKRECAKRDKKQKSIQLPLNAFFFLWSHTGSNCGPTDYESVALTN